MQATHFSSGGRYPVLRTLGILYLIGALVMLGGGVAAAAWAIFGAPDTMANRAVLAAGILAGTFFVVLSMLAIAEVFKLVLDIERNTRSFARSQATMSGDRDVDLPREARNDRRQWLEGEETAEGALIRGH